MELLQRTWGQMCFAFAFRFWHKPDVLLRFHTIKHVTMTCENLSARTQICLTIDHFWESDSTMEKCFPLAGYCTSRSVFVTNVFEPGLYNFNMWTNQFLNLKGMTVLENQCLFTAERSLLCFLLNNCTSTVQLVADVRSCLLESPQLLTYCTHSVHVCTVAFWLQCFPVPRCKFVRG